MTTTEFCLTPQEIERRLKEAGIQVTNQRIAIAQYLLCEGNHPTVEQVMEWAEKKLYKVSHATVYNTLQLLVKQGMVIERRFTQISKTVYDANTRPHHHFIVRNTQEIIDIDFKHIKINTSSVNNLFDIESTETILIGRKK